MIKDIYANYAYLNVRTVVTAEKLLEIFPTHTSTVEYHTFYRDITIVEFPFQSKTPQD